MIESDSTFIKSKLLSGLNVPHGISLRVPGKQSLFSMRPGEVKNRAEFFSALGFSEKEVARASQVHSSNIAVVKNGGAYSMTDGLITNCQNVLLTISIADCVPLLLYDPLRKVVGAVHAGWRGTKDRIVLKALNILNREFHCNMKDVFVYIGPAAGKCCYEVGMDVAVHFSNEFLAKNQNGKYMLDLKSANMAQALEAGILLNNIEVSNNCTICDLSFHSFRREGEKSGRMLAAIGLKNF